jgi:O-antigen ligase
MINPAQQSTFQSRMIIWGISLEIIKKSPILGNGSKNFKKITNEYIDSHYNELTEKFNPDIINSDTAVVTHTHNQYLEILFNHGLIGLALFMGIILYPLWQAVKHRYNFGLLVPLLVHLMIYSITEVPFQYASDSYFRVFVIFSALGYFACLPLKTAQKEDYRNTST